MNYKQKLVTWEKERNKLYEQYEKGESISLLAKRYNVSEANIWQRIKKVKHAKTQVS